MVWASRMHHSRGFGVQSPTDYAFIRYVVNEHWPYYAYGDMLKAHPGIGEITRRLGELYFRIANFKQADAIVDLPPSKEAYRDYFRAGCRKSAIVHSLDEVSCVELLRMDADGLAEGRFADIKAKATDGTVVVVEGIKRSRRARKLWEAMANDECVGVSMDLYYCGILFFDTKRYKQNYIVNF